VIEAVDRMEGECLVCWCVAWHWLVLPSCCGTHRQCVWIPDTTILLPPSRCRNAQGLRLGGAAAQQRRAARLCGGGSSSVSCWWPPLTTGRTLTLASACASQVCWGWECGAWVLA
jgi:hypothetical protein